MSTDTSVFQAKRLVVTGAAGFIGSNLAHWLRVHRRDTSLVCVDALTYAGNLANLAGLEQDTGFQFVRGDIRDAELIGRLLDAGVDGVINAAAHTHVDRSLLGGDDFAGTNVGGVQVLLEAIKQRPEMRFLQVSTDEVYGAQGPDERADEETAYRPGNPYSATKSGGDLLTLAYVRSFGLNAVITRCCNNYGPFQHPEKVIPLFVTNLLAGKPVPLYGDGLHEREWLHVEDHCAAIVCVLETGRAGDIYNITSSERITNLELTRRIVEIMGRDERSIRYVQDRPGHDRRYALNDGKIRGELGWRPRHLFADGLKQTVQWYIEHQDWSSTVRSGEYRNYYERQYGRRIAT